MATTECKVANMHLTQIETGVWAGYDPLTHEVVYASQSMLEGLANPTTEADRGAAVHLTKLGILRQVSDTVHLQTLQSRFSTTAGIFALYLILTDYCNFRCSYCSFFAHLRSDYHPQFMTEKIASQVLDVFRKMALEHEKPLHIILYGGEPLLNKALIRYILWQAGRLDWGNRRRPLFTIITNGSLLDTEILNHLAAFDSDVIVSIDGPAKIHDKYRVGANGNPTYDTVARACDLVHGYPNARLGLSLTLGAHNASTIEDTVFFLKERFDPQSLGLNPLHIDPIGAKHPWDLSREESADAMLRAFSAGRQVGLYIEQITRRIRPFVFKLARGVDCPACGGVLQAYPAGDLGPCGHFVAMGKHSFPVSDPEPSVVAPLMAQWRQRTAFSIADTKCMTCIGRGVCGGGCALNAHKTSSSIAAADPLICIQARRVVYWLLADLWRITRSQERVDLIREGGYVVPSLNERRQILGKIDLGRPRALSSYSSFGEVPASVTEVGSGQPDYSQYRKSHHPPLVILSGSDLKIAVVVGHHAAAAATGSSVTR